MARAGTSWGRRIGDRTLAAIAAALWAVALALVALYVWQGYGSPATSAAAGTLDPAVSATVAAVLPAAAALPPTSMSTSTSTTTATSTTVPKSTPTTSPATAAPPTTSTTAAPPTTTTTAAPPPLTVAAGGDVQGDRNVGTFIDAHGGPAALAKVKPYLETASISFVNLEGPISDAGKKLGWKEYTFRSRLALTSGLASAGIDVVSLANNHAMDCGSSALLDTIARLDEAGINHAGGGADSDAARAPALLIAPAGTVAVFAFTDKHAAGFAAGAEKPGVATISDAKRLLAAIAEAGKKVDFVIVSFHWGTEYTPSAAGYQRALAHKAIDAGADLILGHHPHVIQGLEVYRDRLIAYSLGDFVFDHYKRVTGEAFVLQVTMDRSGPPSATIVPIYLSDPYGIPAPVSGRAADVILDRLTRLSAAYGVKLTRSGDTALLGAPAPAASPGL